MDLPTLTPSQAAFLTSLLPEGYSFQLLPNDQKRQRAPKKLDSSFTSDFSLTPMKRPKRDPQIQSRQSPKEDKEEDKSPGRKSRKDAPREILASLKELKEDTVKPQKRQNKEPTGQIAVSMISAQKEQAMTTLLLRLKMHKSSWPFRMPVDPQAQGVPNYHQVVRQPMDLKTIDRKLKSHSYNHESQFDSDICRVISNSYAFNSPDTVYYSLTKEFQAYYEVLREQMMKNPSLFSSGSGERKNVQEYDEKEREERIARKGEGKRVSAKANKEKEERLREQSCRPQTNKGRTMLTLTVLQRQRLLHQISNLNQRGMHQLVRILWGDSLGEWQQLERDLVDLNPAQFEKLQLFLAQQ